MITRDREQVAQPGAMTNLRCVVLHLLRSWLFLSAFRVNLSVAWQLSTTKNPNRIASPQTLCMSPGDSQEAEAGNGFTRRSVLANSVFLVATTLVSPYSSYAAAVDPEGLVSTKTLADRLRLVPTFCIVDAKGTPFMVVGEDAKVTGYFFTTYAETSRILEVARTTATKTIRTAVKELRAKRRAEKLPPLTKQQEEEEIGTNPWLEARISTVPLDVAVTLVTKSLYSRNYFQVAPAESDVEDALALTEKDDLAEGKVPLFYFADFEISRGEEKQSPLYFSKSQLLEDWKKWNPSSAEIPKVLVTELFSVLTEMVKPGGKDEDLKTLVFVPPKDSAKKQKDCLKAGGKESQFLIGQRIVVL